MAKVDDRLLKELARKYDYMPARIRDLLGFLKVVHEFSQYLANNQYYSEGLNKKVFLLDLDTDTCLLKLEKLKLVSENLCAEVEKSLVAGGKANVEKKQFADLNASINTLEKELTEIHSRALQLTEEIRTESKQKL
ncbi:hypothetical protein HY991_00665 [Candidatus Micrarchaeota archaeon]|nr:hypothetical protein [Candidatus Micrarchaeota archaeon]